MSRHARGVVVAVVGLAVTFALVQAFASGSLLRLVSRGEPLTVKTLGFLGCAAAATAFQRGDHLRRAWFIYGLSFFWIAAVSLLGLLGLTDTGAAAYVGFIFLSNLCGAVGAYLLARTWFLAGIELPASRWTMRSGMLVGVAIGTVMGGYGLYQSLHAYFGDGKISHLAGVASPLGDIASFTFVVPIFLTALALRGGRIAEVWTLLALANLSWLLFDAQSFLPDDAPRWLAVAVEEARLLACTLAGAAGLLQRRVARGDSG